MKNFFLILFKKDIKLIENLSNSDKKNIIYYIIFFLFFFNFLFYIEVIKVEKIILFLVLFFIYLIFKILMELLLLYINNNNNLKKLIRENNEKFNKLLNFLLFIQKWKNPLLLLLLYIDKLFFKFIRFIIYFLKNYKYFNNIINEENQYIFFFHYLLLNIITGPVKLIFLFIYLLLQKTISIPFSFFFIIRSMNFILSTLIFSDLLNYIYNTFGYTKIYIFLIFFCMLVSYIDRDFKFLRIKHLAIYIITDNIINLRNHSTFCGLLIVAIIKYRRYSSLDKKYNLLDKKYIDTLSIYFNDYLEEGFYKYWEYYKRNSWLTTTNIWKEIKNRPSLYLYYNLNFWLNLGAGPLLNGPNFITNVIYIRYKCEKLNLKFPENIKKDLDYLYNLDLLRFKLLLFMLWDIDDYIGYKNINRISYQYDEILNIFFLGCDHTLSNFDDVVFVKSIKANKNNLKFYDVECNMAFFNRLYIIIGAAPYDSHDPLKILVYDVLWKKYDNIVANLVNCLNNFYQDELQKESTWERDEEVYDKDNNIPLIEYKIRDWIILFLEEQRKEWELLQKKESIEERNWRLLNEIDNILLKS